jgi:ADP-ribose pyrophosphatase YjhB (NUDIX family)
MSEVSKVVCAGAVVRRPDGRILVVRRAHPPSEGMWSIPGGRAEPGETLRATARREVAEETGLDIEVGALLGRTELPGRTPDQVYDVSDFAAVPLGDPDALRPGDDASDARWVTRAELDALEVTATLPPALLAWRVWDVAD